VPFGVLTDDDALVEAVEWEVKTEVSVEVVEVLVLVVNVEVVETLAVVVLVEVKVV